MNIPYSSNQTGDKRYLISTYIDEKNAKALHRKSRSAVLVLFKYDRVYPKCTELSLRWMYESKGLFGSEWNLEGNGHEYMPHVVRLVKRLGDERRCI